MRSGFGIFFFIWIILMFSFAFSAVGIIGGLLELLIDLIIPIAFFYFIYKMITGNRNKRNTKKVLEPKVTVRNTNNLLSQNDRLKIDRALRAYFSDHDRLTVAGDINLRPAGGQYSTLRDLDVYNKDDQVAKLNEFSGNYSEFYKETIKLLGIFANTNVNLKDEEVSTKKEDNKKAKEEAKKDNKQQTEFDNAEQYIDRINALNDEIPDEEISNGLYQVTAYLTQIQLIEKKFPEKHAKLKKVYHYYLPILIKILEQYRNFQESARGTEEFNTSEDQLKKTIVLINGALKMITETICAEDLTNLNADMTTLAMLLKNDGLVEEENKLTAGGTK